jgi:hypothetical protein
MSTDLREVRHVHAMYSESSMYIVRVETMLQSGDW